jgi:Tol biopolymer transport system component
VTSIDLPRISPDGTLLAFNATDSVGVVSIWVRRMNSLEAQRLPGTERATRPFWSPDSRYLAYFARGKLHKIDIGGGPPLALCDAPTGADGSWSPRGVILFDGTTGDSIQMVSAAGGLPTAATRIDRASGEVFNAWPQFLPDGRHFVYIAYGRPEDDERTLKVGSIDSEKVKALGRAASKVEYASGHILYVGSGTLLAHPFDVEGLRFSGDPFPVAQGVESDGLDGARFSASRTGTLVYRSGGHDAAARMTWVNRRGERTGTVGPPGDYDAPALSPDGTQLAVERGEPTRPGREVWIWDLSRDLGTRFSAGERATAGAVWSPDGTRLLYSLANSGNKLLVKAVAAGGPESLLVESPEFKVANSWSADGRWITFMMRSGPTGGGFDIYAASLADSTRPVPIVTSPSLDIHSAISPDATLVAYASFESGRPEVFVQSFPGQGGRWRISAEGGVQPTWRGDGRELFYLAPDRGFMSVTVEPGTPPRFSAPRKLFDAPVVVRPITRNLYAPTPDGQRFLMITPEGEPRVGATTVVLDWLARHERN